MFFFGSYDKSVNFAMNIYATDVVVGTLRVNKYYKTDKNTQLLTHAPTDAYHHR